MNLLRIKAYEGQGVCITIPSMADSLTGRDGSRPQRARVHLMHLYALVLSINLEHIMYTPP